MTHAQMMEVSIFDCKTEEQLKEKNKKARADALREYRIYQAYSSTPSFCPANYTYYYGLREKFAPNGHKYYLASQSYRCAVTDSGASDDELDEEKKEWQYLPCETRFSCNGCKK